jgi:Sec-independent protein translocase protein TatA
MNLFGIGLPEVLFILFLALLIFGPKDLAKTGRSLGTSLNKLVRSDTWKIIKDAGREIKNLPTRLMRETGMEEISKDMAGEIKKTADEVERSIPTIGKK